MADYIYADPGRNDRLIADINPTMGNIYYAQTDGLGTPLKFSGPNASQATAWVATYNPFGDTSSFSGTLTNQSVRLPGQYFDPETALNHNGFRDYAGTLTRYIESDPIGLAGGMNTYQYVGGNPFKWVDPSGRDAAPFVPGNPGNQSTPPTPMTPMYPNTLPPLGQLSPGEQCEVQCYANRLIPMLGNHVGESAFVDLLKRYGLETAAEMCEGAALPLTSGELLDTVLSCKLECPSP